MGSGPRAAGAGQSGAARASASPASHTFPVPGCHCLSHCWSSPSLGKHGMRQADGIGLSNAAPERAGSDLQLSSRRLGAPIWASYCLFTQEVLWIGYLGGAGREADWHVGRMPFKALVPRARIAARKCAAPDSLAFHVARAPRN